MSNKWTKKVLQVLLEKNTNTVTVRRFGSGLYDTRYEFTAAETQPKNIFQIKYREKFGSTSGEIKVENR